MYSSVVWCGVFLTLLCDPGHSLHNTKKKTTKSMNSHQKTQEYIKGKFPLFML